MQLFVVLGAATVCGLAAERLNLPGGLIFGAMIGAAAVTVLRGTAVTIPKAIESGSFIIIGAAVGALVNRDSIAAIKAVLLPAVLSGILIIVAGIAIAYLLRVMGIAPPDDILATSPGALSSVSAVAVERGVGPVEVAVFHLVRLILVILSLPALGLLLDSSG
ncbi:MAG: AbrB family transcriptional regulator [Actinobacteria bacterium]|nr:AbrB family transcriptional regulator [Actinomycetota bacterium]